MSRSYKKPWVWISKRWDRFKESAFRRRMKGELRKIEIEIPFDPDADFEASMDYTKMGSWGTKCGWYISPETSDDTWMKESYTKLKRK